MLAAAVPPRPPYVFPSANVLYQPAFVPVAAARAVTPTSDVNLLSLFGWTLGGVFVVEWHDSPIGPYRETAVLSGLVVRGLSLGAWASHIIVTTPEAVTAGVDVFGLPARLGRVEFEARPDVASLDRRGALTTAGVRAVREMAASAALICKTALGTAVPGVAEPAERLRPQTAASEDSESWFRFDADNVMSVVGWDGWLNDGVDCTGDAERSSGPSISLPSFSGCLPQHGGSIDERSALLRYPLRLGPAHRVRLRPAMATHLGPGAVLSEELEAILLGGPCACPCIQVDRVQVEAGVPIEFPPS